MGVKMVVGIPAVYPYDHAADFMATVQHGKKVSYPYR